MEQEEEADKREIQRARRFYTRLRARVERWLKSRARLNERARDYLLLLPDLFTLVVRLAGDRRLSRSLRAQLIVAIGYVLSPVNVIPDFLMPLGLLDDAVVLAFVLDRVVKIMGQAGVEIMREHWDGPPDMLGRIHWIMETADNVVNRDVVGWLKRLFRR